MFVTRYSYWFISGVLMMLLIIGWWQSKSKTDQLTYINLKGEVLQKQSDFSAIHQIHTDGKKAISTQDFYYTAKINTKLNDSYVLPLDKLQQLIPAMKDGKLQLWYPDGKKKVQGSYKNGKPVGLWCHWYPNGRLAITMIWRNGLPNGKTQSWYENGKRRGEINFINGKAEGRWQRWYANGQIKQDMYVHRGVVQTMTTWDKQGHLTADVVIKQNKINGVVLSWYASGAKKSESVFKENELIRKIEWDEDGNIVDLNGG